ncbi:sigma-54 dependent transcriptional regulator [Oceanispirochaeta sp.]|jgi:DNA-binding NtrC family response regulator|uniref:sigma-54-dependent transcriptional regulator n=1 Tax=Oceanispirochaeta sp. TaxID=2035350 RepID=UPI00262FFBB6|nr:sigma-54 dependent transcriptional regulator [Oceanispirochaeta sp.]MDA3958320.1 sigma-54 dependent transcriptional regulator [Oceanispirochaeta sp.]
MNQIILVIDDKEKLCKSLELNFSKLGYEYHYRLNGSTALHFLDACVPDLILLDLALGEEDGLDILTVIKQKQPLVPVIMITGYGSIDTAVKAMKIGASDYIQKPLNFNSLYKIVENTLKKNSSPMELRPQGIITKSEVMMDLYERAKKLADTNFPVLITGESGTGKERIAHLIHDSSPRSGIEMQCINCAAFPENLLDNELFGHEKGAYTGADQQFKGIFERADKSTLFMDEIGDMSLQTQAKILRTLQNNEIRRIGGNNTIKIDVRFIGATNKNLSELMIQKRFREDLYYRLGTAVLNIPPLRERVEEIASLAEYFLKEQFEHKDYSFSKGAMEKLRHYDWPGNIRELRNAVHYAGAMVTGQVINEEDIPRDLHGSSSGDNPAVSLEEYEKSLIMKALKQALNNKSKAAEILNISRKTLYNKLDKYGLSGE